MLESPYSSKAATSCSPERAISTKSDSLLKALPQWVVLYLNSRIWFMACTGITDFHLRAWWSGDWIPVGGEIFRTRPGRPWGPPNPLYNGYRVFPGCKAAGAWRLPPTPSSAEVKEGVELYLYSTGPSWPVLGWPLPLLRVYVG